MKVYYLSGLPMKRALACIQELAPWLPEVMVKSVCGSEALMLEASRGDYNRPDITQRWHAIRNEASASKRE